MSRRANVPRRWGVADNQSRPETTEQRCARSPSPLVPLMEGVRSRIVFWAWDRLEERELRRQLVGTSALTSDIALFHKPTLNRWMP